MANKNLIKRAFSVTANLPGTAAMPDPAEAPKSAPAEISKTPQAASPAPAAASTPVGVTPRTGPGSMLAFMTEQSEVHREVVQLRERVADFEGADVVRQIDPADIKLSRWANRESAHFATEAFARLKAEIATSGGNVQPIKVRALSAAEGERRTYEIVYGHRRHRACLELGLPVSAMVQTSMKDADLFVEMERENRNREDLSAWEQGMMYLRALEQGLFPSAKQLAAAIDRDLGNIGRAMALAKLPAEVVAAFGSALNLQFRWATPLKDAHQRDPEGLLATARALSAQDPAPSPAEVFAALTGQGKVKGAGDEKPTQWHNDQGVSVASMTQDRKGRVIVSIDRPMDEAQRRKLIKLIDGFLGLKS